MPIVDFELNIKTGERKYTVKGVQGEGCTDITKAFTDANEELESEKTEEFLEQAERPDFVEQGE